MKIGLVTDTHFGARNDNQNFNDYFYRFYDEIFFPKLIEDNITTVIHLGDVMDRRKFVSYKTATDFRTKFLDRIEELNIDFHIILSTKTTHFHIKF